MSIRTCKYLGMPIKLVLSVNKCFMNDVLLGTKKSFNYDNEKSLIYIFEALT